MRGDDTIMGELIVLVILVLCVILLTLYLAYDSGSKMPLIAGSVLVFIMSVCVILYYKSM